MANSDSNGQKAQRQQLDRLQQETHIELAGRKGHHDLDVREGWDNLKLRTAKGAAILLFGISVATLTAIVVSWFGASPVVSPELVVTHLLTGGLGVLLSDHLPKRPRDEQPGS